MRTLLLLCGACCHADAYRIGDAVGILLRTHTPSRGGGTVEPYRHQLPRFGVSTKTRFAFSSLDHQDALRLPGEATASPKAPRQRGRGREEARAEDPLREHLRLALSFDAGLHRLPWLDAYNPARRDENVLQHLEITIIYSGSDGSIHAVHRDATYRARGAEDGTPASFTVEYVWVNEADADVRAGLLALFAAVVLVALSGLAGACRSPEDGREGPRPTATGAASGFAKRL